MPTAMPRSCSPSRIVLAASVQRARGGRAAVVDVGERDAGEARAARRPRRGCRPRSCRRTRTGCRATRRPRRRARGGSRSRPSRSRSHPGSGRTGAARRRRSRRPSLSSAPLSRPAGTRTSRPRCRRRRCGTAPATSSISMPDREHVGIGLGEPRLDLHLAGQLDVADAEGHERRCPVGPAYGGDGGGKSCVVHAHSRPRRASRCSAISVDAQRGHESCAGKVTMPHALHRLPISCGSSRGPREDAFRHGDLRHHVLHSSVPPRASVMTAPTRAQLVLDDLAGRVHGQRVEELDRARHLEVRHLARAPTRRSPPARSPDPGSSTTNALRDLAEALVGHADHRDLRDARVAQHAGSRSRRGTR